MVAGILSVLKIIGIILLVILAVILFILLLVLFVPVFYRADALIPETEFDDSYEIDKKLDVNKIMASTSFSWLWFVIRGNFDYPEDKQFTLRVFGIKVLPKKKKPETSKEENKKDEEKTETVTETNSSSETEEAKADTSHSEGENGSTENTEESGKEEHVDEQSASDEQSTSAEQCTMDQQEESADTSQVDEEDESKSILDVLWKIFDSIDNFLKTPLNVFEKIKYTISRVCDKIDMIKSTLENPIFKRAFELVKKKLIKVIKMILPKKCDIKLLYGSGNPASTAEIMGFYGALYPVLYKKVDFTPDFERGVAKVDAHIKGHITIFTIVFCTAVCFFNKDVKKTIKRFKKIINS